MTGPLHLAVVGGTGPQGRGLAYRFALAGHSVTIGSRDAHHESAAEEVQRLVPEARVVGAFHHVAALSLWKTPAPLGQMTRSGIAISGVKGAPA